MKLQQIGASAATIAKGTGHSLITWSWTKKLLHWLIISAGTMSECVFLIASLWMSINANVHQFVLLFIDENTTRHITELATTAYVALPECIVGLAVVVTIGHVRVWLYKKSDIRALIWSVLYLLPTVVFLYLSLVTLGNAVASVDFKMPTELVVIRALAGYVFAFTSLLYTQLGTPQEKDRLDKKDIEHKKLQAETDNKIADLQLEINKLASIIDQQKQELQKTKRQNETLQNTVIKTADDGLEAYSLECKNWLKGGIKTATVEEINRYTGHSKRKIENAIDKGNLKLSPRGEKLILISSLLEWLKNTPLQPTQSVKIIQLNQMNTDELEAVSR